MKEGFPGAGEAGAAGGMPVSVGLGVGDVAGAFTAGDGPVAPAGHMGMGIPDGSGMGSGGRHVGIPLGKHVGTPDGIGTGSDRSQPWMLSLELAAVGSVLGALAWRIGWAAKLRPT